MLTETCYRKPHSVLQPAANVSMLSSLKGICMGRGKTKNKNKQAKIKIQLLGHKMLLFSGFVNCIH